MKQHNILASLIAVIVSATTLILPATLFANDSTARLGAGGIEFLQNEHIRMIEEVLEISADNVRVKYRFLNESDQDIQTTVAFPLPFFDGLSHANTSIGDPRITAKTFTVLVNGAPVPTSTLWKAVTDGRDITDELRKLGFSDKEIFFDVPGEEWKALEQKIGRFGSKLFYWWGIDQTIYWQMIFPAKKETVVEHEYVPASGRGYAIVGAGESKKDFQEYLNKLWDSFTGKGEERRYEDCLDDMTKRGIENRVKQAVFRGAESVSVEYTTVEYILGTGRNWKGPIREFTLRLVKEDPDEFVSVCFRGKPKKIGPRVYEFHQKDFVPPDKLLVYFYIVNPSGVVGSSRGRSLSRER
ncbi:MAG: DUF4424 family protein [Thermodesulfobacteriota bacterium]